MDHFTSTIRKSRLIVLHKSRFRMSGFLQYHRSRKRQSMWRVRWVDLVAMRQVFAMPLQVQVV
ncbi:hypothetical protein CJ198_05950 [Brevibacterium luteolum]|uniref:Uncharacterized protein n=1 Tax=Brevibacterium luteolum TaxID=199591 RepID=A0A2N6PJG9_9MICO|nr:hypothetical protein CJ198_05950 [Brevibacterium luteolum]